MNVDLESTLFYTMSTIAQTLSGSMGLLGAIVLFVLLQLRVGRRRQRLARRTQESLSEMTAITEEALSVSGILLAKVFNR